MKSVMVKVLIASVIIIAAGAVVQTANAEGPLPIKPGIYVSEDVPCNEATNASRVYYELLEHGYGLSWPHSECTITNVHNKGNVYYVTQRCVFKGVKGEISKHMTIIVKSETSFSILNDAEERKRTKKKEHGYRWCQD
jgi:hypothetical protein